MPSLSSARTSSSTATPYVSSAHCSRARGGRRRGGGRRRARRQERRADGANEDPLPTDPTADQHVALPEGCHVEPGVAGPAIAVCFYGVHRSAETIRSIREGLLAPLRRVGSVDIFAHLMQPRVFTNARTGEANVPAPSAASLFSSLAPCGFSLTEQSSADLELAALVWPPNDFHLFRRRL